MNSDEPSMRSAGARVSHGKGVLVGDPIVTEARTWVPAVLVHDGAVHLYTGHDEAPPDAQTYEMNDWLGFSSDDLLTWHSHGPLLAVDTSRTAGLTKRAALHSRVRPPRLAPFARARPPTHR